MKAIIIAAGPGSRLRPLTDSRPKCLLEVGGKTIMQRQLETLRACGIRDIVVVRGYQGHLITYPGLTFYENPNYENNNILASLFCAEEAMSGGFVFSYSDILYGKDVVTKLLSSDGDISLTADVDWRGRYEGRDLHPIAEAELVGVKGGRVVRIGKKIMAPEQAHGEFIGLARFSGRGAQNLRNHYHRAAREYGGGPFHQAASLEKAYLTDMMQELVDQDCPVYTADIERGWMEIDTPQDLQQAEGKIRLWQ